MPAETAIDEVTPQAAFETLAVAEGTALIDVRTSEEWQHVGVPDIAETGRPLWFIEWLGGSERVPNSEFLRQVMEKARGHLPERMFFICRSGVRSAAAAQAVAALATQLGQRVQCTNVAEGFEGARAWGEESGWRRRGLPCGVMQARESCGENKNDSNMPMGTG